MVALLCSLDEIELDRITLESPSAPEAVSGPEIPGEARQVLTSSWLDLASSTITKRPASGEAGAVFTSSNR